jgi:hypothetical protein
MAKEYKLSQSQKFDMEHGLFFIEHFYSIGLDMDLIFDDSLYSSSLQNLNESMRLKPMVISKYPPVKKTNLKMDESTLIKVSQSNEF